MTRRSSRAGRMSQMPSRFCITLLLGTALACVAWPTVAAGELADQGKTDKTITDVPVAAIDPPEKDFYAKRLDYHGLPIKGAGVVSDAAFYEAWRRIDRLLRNDPVILANLLAARSEVHIIGKDQGQTDLP